MSPEYCGISKSFRGIRHLIPLVISGVLLHAHDANAVTFTAGSNWGDPTKWMANGATGLTPGAGDSISGNLTITMTGPTGTEDVSGTIGYISVGAMSGSTIFNNIASGTATLTFDTGDSTKNATITSSRNSGKVTTFNVAIVLNSNLSTSDGYGNIVFNKAITSGTDSNGIPLNTGLIIGGKTDQPSGYVVLNAACSYSGSTVINGNIKNQSVLSAATPGRLQIGVDNALPTGTILYVNGGSKYGVSGAVATGGYFDLNGHNQVVAGLSGTAGDAPGTIINYGTGNSTLTINGSTSQVYSGAIKDGTTGTVSLAIAGNATQTLDGANTFSGTTTVSENGKLILTNGLALQNSVLASGGAGLVFDASVGNHAFAIGGINGSNGIALVDNAGNAIDLSVGGGTVAVSSNYAGVLSGSGSFTKVGNGTVTLSGANTYSGVTTVSAGNLTFGTKAALYGGNAGAWTTDKVVVNSGATLGLRIGGADGFSAEDVAQIAALGTSNGGLLNGSLIGFDTTNGDFSYGSVVADTNGGANSIGLAKVGPNTLTLTAQNTYTGATVISSGTLSVGVLANGGAASGIGASSSDADNLVFDGGALKYTGASVVTDRSVTINSGKVATIDTDNDLTLGSIVSVDGGLTKNGVGILTLNGANSFTGAVAINAGTLRQGSAGVFGSSANTLALGTNAKLQLNGHDAAFVSISGTDSSIVENGSATDAATVTDNLAASGTFSGILRNGGSAALNFAKVGSGTLTLTNANTYTGATTINGGGMVLSGNGTIAGSSGVTVTGLLTASNSTTTVSNRLGSGALTLRSGAFNLTYNTTTPASVSESIGALTFDSGANAITLSGTVTSTATTTLTASSLARNNNAVTLIRGAGLGQNTGKGSYLKISGGSTGLGLVGGGGAFGTSTTPSTNISIIPYLVGGSSNGDEGTTFIGYDSANGLRALSTSYDYRKFNNATSVDLTSGVGATDNIYISGTATAIGINAGSSGATVNSMVFNMGASATVGYTLSGTMNVSSGALLFCRAGTSTTSRSQNVSGGTIQFGDAEGIITNTGSNTVTISSQISGNKGLTLTTFTGGSISSAGSAITISGNNNYSGATTVNGMVILGNSEVIPDASAVTIAQGATLKTTITTGSQTETIGSLSGAGTLALSTTSTATTTVVVGNDNSSTTFSGTITGKSGNLTKTGTGVLTLAGANTFGGATTINGGTLALANAGALGSISSLVFGGGSLQYSASNQGDYSALIKNSASAISVDTNGQQVTYASAIDSTNTAGLTKSGSGTLVLAASNTYTGTTTVSGGELDVNGSVGSSTVVVGSGAILGGSGSVGGNVNVTGGAVNGSGLNIVGKTTFNGNSILGGNMTSTSGIQVASAGVLNVVGHTTSTVTVDHSTLKGSGSTGGVVLIGGTLNGTLSTGDISGTGLVSPGNSPGILTSTSVTVSSGLDFAFELTQAAPNYANSTNSGNDVLHLTGNTPFSTSLTAGNAISVYLSSGADGTTYIGGFFADHLSAALLKAAVADAQFSYYILDTDGNYTGDVSFNGKQYTAFDSSKVSISALDMNNAGFASGSVNGSVLEFTVVPEPGTWALMLGGFGMLLGLQKMRRKVS